MNKKLLKILFLFLSFLGFEIEQKNRDYDKFSVRFVFMPFNWLTLIIGIQLSLSIIFGSWFTLDKTEKGSIQYFGKFSHEVGPGGFYFKVPIIANVKKVGTEIRYRHEVGFRTIDDGDTIRVQEVPEEAVMLTKGGHLASVYWIIQYTIQDTYNWLYQVAEPEQVLDRLSQGSMRLIVGQTQIDGILTTEKEEIQEKNKKLLQEYCDLIGLKAKINEVKLQDCGLPDPKVQAAYDNVMNSIKKKEQMQNDGVGYANDVIPRANGTASIILNGANSYFTNNVNGAKGEVSRFMGMYEEYRKDPTTTRKKLWFEAMQEVMPAAKKTIMTKEALINLKQF